MTGQSLALPTLVSVRLPSGVIEPRGKIFRVPDEAGVVRTVYYRDVSERALIRFADAWPIDTGLLDWLDQHGVEAIHYHAGAVPKVSSALLHWTDSATLRRQGIRRTMNGRAQHLLPRDKWNRGRRAYVPPPVDAAHNVVVTIAF